MPKYLLLLLLLCANASAEWQNVGGDMNETAYVDTVVHRDRDRVKMWALFDLKAAHAFGDMAYLSMKIQREYHCRDKKSRIVAMQAYAGNMGAGELIYSNNSREKWQKFQSDSVEEMLWNMACKSSS
ncbi:MAG: surface-adhesin E family protein [Nitrosomonadales bacterium]